jgi:shikimate dehydrogenase
MTDRYAVMGHPVAHSKSPFIHACFAEQTGQDLTYDAIDVPADGFAQALEAFRAEGGCGINVTLPFKEEAWRLVAVRSERAQRAGAVNTIWFDHDDRAHGDNTDGVGLVRDIVINHGGVLAAQRILLVGAGGAARGVLGPLVDAAPARLVIANRTAGRARELARAFDAGVCGLGFDELEGETFELVINATSAGLRGQLPALPDSVLARRGWCYDMVYGDAPTPFMVWGRAHGAGRVLDGLGMLVEQAAESFLIWRHVRPDTAPVIAALRRGPAPGNTP